MENKQERTYAGMTRRTLCLGAGGAAVMLGLGGLKYAGSQSLVRPPGGQDEERLISACIRCEKCYEICPRDVIAPAHLEDGVLNMRTPTFDFSANWCDWCADEHDGTPLCVSACPTEALKLPADATAENTIIGKAVIREDWCLAYKLTGCRFCYDACPYEAMELDKDNRLFELGYDQRVTKENTTAAIDGVSADEMKLSGEINPLNTLYGLIPGLGVQVQRMRRVRERVRLAAKRLHRRGGHGARHRRPPARRS